ncbi:hypothetical protein [Streptomyces sp. Ag109_G2-15]|uniref:hypothetical protein n=1 Tax=Streptomyces sp. Ag109_G2-15 TaxID=1938850 RepID=UPI000BDDD141|nr:hypothetical protein [Streptomyces sp. Ag109_G2-15]SOE06986.1 hypothetical protein SAMN06272765_7861 [Streptomyces sp. Ag109_G2-15]
MTSPGPGSAHHLPDPGPVRAVRPDGPPHNERGTRMALDHLARLVEERNPPTD